MVGAGADSSPFFSATVAPSSDRRRTLSRRRRAINGTHQKQKAVPPFGGTAHAVLRSELTEAYFLLATFGCSAVLTSSKLSTTRLLMTDTASSLAFCTRPESSRTLARAD